MSKPQRDHTHAEVQAERLAAIKARHANNLEPAWAWDDIAWLVNRADERNKFIWTLSQCEQQLQKDQRERDELRADLGSVTATLAAAEAEVERLQAALEKIAHGQTPMVGIAREALGEPKCR